MSAGRKIIPIEEKKAKGTYRKHRDKGKPEVSNKKPIPPSWLNKRAKQIFQLLTKRLGKRATATYTEVQAMCASRYEESERFTKALDEGIPVRVNKNDGKGDQVVMVNGYVYQSSNSFGDPVLKENPMVRLREKALRHAQSLLVEMGLTDISGLKFGSGEKGKKKSEFDGF
jgi:P27 family predicted phage terminase small subunit